MKSKKASQVCIQLRLIGCVSQFNIVQYSTFDKIWLIKQISLTVQMIILLNLFNLSYYNFPLLFLN